MFERLVSILALVVATIALVVATQIADYWDKPMGVCVDYDSTTNITLVSTPVKSGDVISCKLGNYVSVVPEKNVDTPGA